MNKAECESAPFAGLMRARRIEPHPKVASQPLASVLQTVMPRLQKDKQLKTDAISNTENAIADLVSKGEPFAGVRSRPVMSHACTCLICMQAQDHHSMNTVLRISLIWSTNYNHGRMTCCDQCMCHRHFDPLKQL